MAAIYRGLLGSDTNAPLIDQGTHVRTRAPNPGVSCATRDPGIFDRVHQVRLAWEIAKARYVPEAIIHHTRQDLYDAIQGILPGLLYALGLVIVSTAVGALIGGVAGEGVGAGPGAAAGFGVGMAILEYLGLGFLVIYLVKNAYEVGDHIMTGAKLAWHACGDNDLDNAAKEMAEGVGVFFSVLVQAVIAMVAKEGLGAAVSKVSKSRLGTGFGTWLRGRVTLGGLLKAVDRPPGQYLFTKNAAGRTVEAEGWLVKANGGAYDANMRARIVGELAGYHAGHIIPRTFGGPPIAENLVPMTENMNLSYVKAVENAVGRRLDEGGVYLKVTLRYEGSDPVPKLAQHQFYRLGKDGMEMIPGGDVSTNLGASPSGPLGKYVVPRDFMSPDPKKGVINDTIH